MTEKKKTDHDDSTDLRKRAEEALAQQNDALSKLNHYSIELSMLSPEDNLEVFITKRLKEFTGAVAATFSEYNPEKRTLTPKHIELEPGLLKKVVNLLGKQVNKIHAVVSDEMYREMTTESIGMRRTLYEASFGAISHPVEATIQALLKADRFIGLAYLIEGKLYGSSLLAMSKDQPDLPKEILENFLFLAAVSLHRKLAEAALRESEEKYRGIFENVLDVYYETAIDGTILEVSPSIEIASKGQYHRDDLIGKSMNDFYTDPGKRQTLLKALRERGSVTDYEIKLKNRDGSVTPCSIASKVHFDAQGRPHKILGTIRDITERKKAEAEIIEREAFNFALFEYNPIQTVVVDLEGKVIKFNLAKKKSGDRLPNIGDTMYKDYAGKHKIDMYAELMKCIRSGEEKEFPEQKYGDRVFSTTISPFHKGAVIISEDITGRKRAEDVLRENEIRYRELFEAESDAIVLIDNATGNILEANSATVALYGYDHAELLTKRNSDLSAEPEETQRVTHGTPIISDQVVTIPLRFHRKKDGTVFPTEITGRFFIREGRPVHIVAIRDITERKKAEKEIQSLAKFPGENPEPILRIARDGTLLYINQAGLNLLPEWHLQVGKATPLMLREAVLQVLDNGSTRRLDLEHLRRIYSFSVVPIAEAGYANLYGLDITERKRAEEALRTSEAKYSLLTETTHDIIFVIDRDGRVEYINTAAARAFGEPSQNVIGKAHADLFSPEIAEAQWRSLQKVFESGEPLFAESRLIFPHGEMWASVQLVPFRREGGKVTAVMGVSRDITERKREEEALAKSEALFREAQGAAHIGHWELDTSIMTPAWSEEIFRIFGLDPEEGEPSFEAHQKITHPDDWGILNNAVTTSIVEGLPFDIKFRILRPDKTIRWLHAIGYPKEDHKGRIVSVFGTAQDITEKKSMEDALLVSLEKYRVVFESFPLGINISDKSGKIMEGNRQSEKLLGITLEALAQRRIDSKEWRIIRKDGTPMPADEYASSRALRENRLIENVEMGIVKDKGEITWISVTAAPIPLEGYGVAITYGDISERISAEQASKRAESQREAALEEVRRKAKELQEKNEELARFTYAVSHDLRSPLVTIQTFQGHLERDIKSQDAARVEKDLGYIRNAADKMGRLLDDIRRLSRVGRIMNPSEDAPLQAIVKEALGLVAGRISRRGVKVQVTEEPVVLTGDRTRFVEIFMNLVDNAVKFMGDQPEPRVEIGVEHAGEELVLHVRDNGIGIDPQVQPLVFGLFHKIDPETEGEGIGLALVKRIVELHGGRIWVESEGSGKGTTLRFTLARTRGGVGRGERT